MNYKQKYEQALERAKVINPGTADYEVAVKIFPELKESEDDRIRKEIIQFLRLPHSQFVGKRNHEEWIAWLEKQGKRSNPYSGISFEYNGHTWGMCARDNGVDLMLDKQFFKHIATQGEQKSADWSEEDEKMLQQTLSIIRYGLSIPIDKEDDPCFVGSSTISWLKSLKERMKGK